eukprot:5952978-Pyramimonas_sp.AAC.1
MCIRDSDRDTEPTAILAIKIVGSASATVTRCLLIVLSARDGTKGAPFLSQSEQPWDPCAVAGPCRTRKFPMSVHPCRGTLDSAVPTTYNCAHSSSSSSGRSNSCVSRSSRSS